MEKIFLLIAKINTAHALEAPPGNLFTQVGSFKSWITNILTFIFGAAGAIFVIMIIVGGVQYLTSAGNEENATKAKKLITDAVIGIVIVVSAWAIADWVLKGIGGYANFG